MNYWQRITLVWVGFFVLAFINGALREMIIKRFIKEPWAHHLSVLTAILLFSALVFIYREHVRPETLKLAIYAGLYWLVLTMFAETFIVGRLIGKQSWNDIFSNYNILKGHLWPLVLAWVALLPFFVRIIN